MIAKKRRIVQREAADSIVEERRVVDWMAVGMILEKSRVVGWRAADSVVRRGRLANGRRPILLQRHRGYRMEGACCMTSRRSCTIYINSCTRRLPLPKSEAFRYPPLGVRMARIDIQPWPLRLGLPRSGASISSGSVDGCMPILGTSLASKMRPLHTSDGILNLDTSHGTEAGPAGAGVKASDGRLRSSGTPGV